MAPFWCLFIYLGIVAFSTSKLSDEQAKFKYQAVLGGLGLWLLLALRSWTCGQDLYYYDKGVGYIVTFLRMDGISFSELLQADADYEIGFRILNWIIINYISSNPQIFLAIIAAIEIGLIGFTFYKQSSNIILSYLVFACLGLYIFGFSGLRQILGVSITFFAFNFINCTKPYKFIIFVLLACTMHKSSILFLPAVLFRKSSLPFSKTIFYILGIIIVLPVLMPIIQFFSVLLYGKEKYGDYEGGAYGLFLLFIFMFFYSYSCVLKTKEKIDKMTRLRWMALFAVFFQSSGILSAGALARIAYSYSIFFSLLLPMTLEFTPKNYKYISKTFVIMFLLFFFFYTNKGGFLNVIPYRFFWEEVYF